MLHKIWEKWKAFGEFLGNLFARVVLTLFYFTLFVPFAVITQLFSDHLDTRTAALNLWRPRQVPVESIEEARGQS